MSEDTISRQAAINAIIAKLDAIDHVPQWVFDELTGAIGDLPSAQPEIIRCKDCYYKNRYRFPPQYEERDYCEKHDKVVRENCYCAWAERRQDEGSN